MSAADWFRQNAAGFGGELRFDEPLARHTYYRIGGPCRVLAIPRSVEELRWVWEGARASGLPMFVLGAGSNLLVSDLGFEGLVVKTGRLNLGMEADGACLVTGASVAVSSLLRRASAEGWDGLEFLTGIPGSVGGVVAMNGGTHLGEAKDRLRRVEAFVDGSLRAYAGAELRFEYRRNLFLPDGAIVYAAEWEIARGEPAAVKRRIDDVLARRKATQPLDYPSCGSVFKNPPGFHAWQVIEKIGLRGHRIGEAQFSEKHCNFILNLGAARAAEVRALIDLAKTRALQELGIQLEEEVRYLG
jgi:UDP-N-acetylmuramate dehydrogenase